MQIHSDIPETEQIVKLGRYTWGAACQQRRIQKGGEDVQHRERKRWTWGASVGGRSSNFRGSIVGQLWVKSEAWIQNKRQVKQRAERCG